MLPIAVTYYNKTVYVADQGNNRVRYLKDRVWYNITKVGIADYFNMPSDVEVDSHGNLYIGDTHNNRIIKKQLGSKAYEIITHPTYIHLGSMMCVSKDGILYISSPNGDTVAKKDGTVFTLLMGPGTNLGKVNGPFGIYDDGLGTIYVADKLNSRVQRSKSGVNTLSALKLDGISVPSFSPTITSYSITYSHDKNSVIISAEATSPYATLEGDIGSRSLTYGLNTFLISAKPEVGSDLLYTINITRENPPATPVPTPTPVPTDEPTPEPTPEPISEPTPTEEPAPESTSESEDGQSEQNDEKSAEESKEAVGDNENEEGNGKEDTSSSISKQIPTGIVILITILSFALVTSLGYIIVNHLKKIKK